MIIIFSMLISLWDKCSFATLVQFWKHNPATVQVFAPVAWIFNIVQLVSESVDSQLDSCHSLFGEDNCTTDTTNNVTCHHVYQSLVDWAQSQGVSLKLRPLEIKKRFKPVLVLCNVHRQQPERSKICLFLFITVASIKQRSSKNAQNSEPENSDPKISDHNNSDPKIFKKKGCSKKNKNRMEIFGTSRDNISTFWENKVENERQIFILKIDLETIPYMLEKVSNLPSCCFVCLSFMVMQCS